MGAALDIKLGSLSRLTGHDFLFFFSKTTFFSSSLSVFLLQVFFPFFLHSF